MKQQVHPEATARAQAWQLWKDAPMPMVTILKALDITALRRFGRRHGLGLHLLMCWCIGCAAAGMEEFYLLPDGGGLARYDRLAVDTVVALPGGSITTCDVPFSRSLGRFARDYRRLTRQAQQSGRMHDLSQACMVIGTSALAACEIDGVVNFYAGEGYPNPFFFWGKCRRKGLAWQLPVSFQFHHVQMDGAQAAAFLLRLQRRIDTLLKAQAAPSASRMRKIAARWAG